VKGLQGGNGLSNSHRYAPSTLDAERSPLLVHILSSRQGRDGRPSSETDELAEAIMHRGGEATSIIPVSWFAKKLSAE